MLLKACLHEGGGSQVERMPLLLHVNSSIPRSEHSTFTAYVYKPQDFKKQVGNNRDGFRSD